MKNYSKNQTSQHRLSDWRTAISSQPKIKQPGDQGNERTGKDPKINQSNAADKSCTEQPVPLSPVRQEELTPAKNMKVILFDL